jgi:hypothetical protein
VVVVQAMPGTPPLKPTAEEQPVGVKLGRVAAALGVLSLGLALVMAPTAVLGGVLSTSAESITGDWAAVAACAHARREGCCGGAVSWPGAAAGTNCCSKGDGDTGAGITPTAALGGGLLMTRLQRASQARHRHVFTWGGGGGR